MNGFFKGLFWVVFISVLLFVVLLQVFSDYRHEYGRYGRRGIVKRKRKENFNNKTTWGKVKKLGKIFLKFA